MQTSNQSELLQVYQACLAHTKAFKCLVKVDVMMPEHFVEQF